MQKKKSMVSYKHLNVESLYLYADHVFGYENGNKKSNYR